jgi:LPXTG-motif cell wall-anchored protein
MHCAVFLRWNCQIATIRQINWDSDMSTIGTLIETHGYWVLAIGCLLEGETILILAGFAAHRGYLNPFAVVAVAACAGFVGDQFYFWLGRRHGSGVVARWPSIARQQDRVHDLIQRYDAALIVGIRFAYGLRIAGPVLMGMSPLSGYRFALLNALGAILWAGVIAALGWVFGNAAEALLGEVRHVEGWLLLGLALFGLAAWWVRRRREK